MVPRMGTGCTCTIPLQQSAVGHCRHRSFKRVRAIGWVRLLSCRRRRRLLPPLTPAPAVLARVSAPSLTHALYKEFEGWGPASYRQVPSEQSLGPAHAASAPLPSPPAWHAPLATQAAATRPLPAASHNALHLASVVEAVADDLQRWQRRAAGPALLVGRGLECDAAARHLPAALQQQGWCRGRGRREGPRWSRAPGAGDSAHGSQLKSFTSTSGTSQTTATRATATAPAWRTPLPPPGCPASAAPVHPPL